MYEGLSYRLLGSALHDVQEHLRFLLDNVGRLGFEEGTAPEQIREMDIRL